MAVLKNRAKMSTSTTGTGTITLGSAESGYQTFADAGVANADVVRYVIEDTGGAFEIGTGTYTATGTTLSRTVSESSNSDAAINLSGSATVFIGATAEDIPALYAENYDSFATKPSATATNGVAIGKNAVAGGGSSLAAGAFASSGGNLSTAVGLYSNVGSSGSYAVALGWAYANGTNSLAAAITNNTSTYGATGANSVAIGREAKAVASDSLALGWASQTSGNGRSTAIGYLTHASDFGATALGYDNDASGSYSTAIGRSTNVSGDNSVGIGYQAGTSVNNQVVLGGTTQQVKISNTYTLPTADGTNGQVLTTDGSGAVTFADAGGDPDLYTANASTPTANTVTGSNSVAIGENLTVSGDNSLASGTGGTATGYSSFAFGDGADATGNHSVAIGGGAIQASGAQSIAIGYGSDATNTDAHAFGRNANASGSSSTALGRDAVASTTRAVALGDSRANGVDSLAAAIADNSASYGASGANSVAMGKLAKATGTESIAIGRENIASGVRSFAAGGYNATASGTDTIAIGYQAQATATKAVAIGFSNEASGESSLALGYNSDASADYSKALGTACQATATGSTAIGEYARASGASSFVISTDITGDGTLATASQSIAIGANSKSAVIGKIAHSSKRFAANGDAQGGIFVLLADTTDATATVLTTNNGTASTDNQIVAASDTCIMFSGTLVAMQNGAQDQGGWEIKGLLKNDGGTTTLVSSNIQTFDDGNGWVVALTADNTNNALAITCTGEAAHNIRWVANIQTSEVTYA